MEDLPELRQGGSLNSSDEVVRRLPEGEKEKGEEVTKKPTTKKQKSKEVQVLKDRIAAIRAVVDSKTAELRDLIDQLEDISSYWDNASERLSCAIEEIEGAEAELRAL